MKTNNKTNRWLAAILLITSMLMTSLSSRAQTTNYFADFENPPFTSGLLNGQNTWISANTNAHVWTDTEIAADLSGAGQTPGTTVHGGTQALLTSGGGASQNSTRVITGVPNYSKVTVDLWAQPIGIRTDAASLGNIFFTLESVGGTLRAAAFRFGYDSATTNTHIDYADGAVGSAVWKSTGIPWNSNTWYQITFDVDYALQTYDFSINGTKVNANPISFYTGNFVTTLGLIRVFRGTSQAGMILDDLTITSVAATNPIALLGPSNPYGFKISIADVGTTTPDTNTITTTLDGVSVTPSSIVQSGNIGGGDGTGLTIVSYNSPTPIMTTGTTHTNTIHFEGTGFSPVDRTFTFTIAPVIGSLDRTHHYLGRFQGTTLPKYSPFTGGRSGAPGDFAVDMGTTNFGTGKFFADDLEMLRALNGAVQNDTLSCSIWTKRRAIYSSSIFWLNSPTAPVSGRAFQLHGPYSDNTFYFDTGGGTVPTSRLSTNVLAYLGGVDYWTNWHHIVAIKDGGIKQIWIDGELLIEQASGAASISGYNDLNRLVLGAASPDNLIAAGVVDDFAAYSSALSPADIAALHGGTAPNAIAAAPNLLAWWDFNDGPGLSLEKTGSDTVVTFTQMLQSSTNASGPYIDEPGATSPHTNDLSADPQKFFRTRKY